MGSAEPTSAEVGPNTKPGWAKFWLAPARLPPLPVLHGQIIKLRDHFVGSLGFIAHAMTTSFSNILEKILQITHLFFSSLLCFHIRIPFFDQSNPFTYTMIPLELALMQTLHHSSH